MKRNILSMFLTCFTICSFAQVNNTFYGLARSISPTNEVYLAELNTSTGVVTNISNSPVAQIINLTGASLNPYSNTYHFLGVNEIKTLDLATGALLNSALISNPVANSYFDNFRFNHSDSTIYGLLRRTIIDSVSSTTTTEIYLGTIDPQTGVIQQISPSSVAQGYAMTGSAIDPYQKVFYFFDGSNLIGLDMYNGSIYSNVAVQSPTGGANTFDNIAYSCVDSSIYGLIKENHYSTIYDPTLMDSITILDSTTLRLGKINPATGVVTVISPNNIVNGGFAYNSGSTIDQTTMTYYFNKGDTVVGVSLNTGLVVNQLPLSNSSGQFFELMRIHSNCAEATKPVRLNGSSPTSLNSNPSDQSFAVVPNPASDRVELNYNLLNNGTIRIRILNLFGQLMYEKITTSFVGKNNLSFNTNQFSNGFYVIELLQGEKSIRQRLQIAR